LSNLAKRTDADKQRDALEVAAIRRAASVYYDNAVAMMERLLADFMSDETDPRDRVRIMGMMQGTAVARDRLRDDLGLKGPGDAVAAAGLAWFIAGLSVTQKARMMTMPSEDRQRVVLSLVSGREKDALRILDMPVTQAQVS
jgi:hypothetical protein